MRLLAVALLTIGLTACGELRRTPPDNVGLGAITAVTMQKTPCYGTCPDFSVRFLADGRARYVGGPYAPRQGRYSGLIDFAPVAAWIATQHPETLPDEYPTAGMDAPAVNLEIDYGARRIRFTNVAESSASLRLEGILLALDGAASRIRWRRDDAATAFLGTFRGSVVLNVGEDGVGGFSAHVMPNGCPGYPYRVKVVRGMMRVRCDTRTSTMRSAGDDLQADGDAIPPGRYDRVSPYAVFPDVGMDARHRPSE